MPEPLRRESAARPHEVGRPAGEQHLHGMRPGLPAHPGGGPELTGEIAESLGQLVRELDKHHAAETLLPAIISATVALVPGAEEGSISAVKGRRGITCEAPTSDLPRQVDALQERYHEGPCLDAAYQQRAVRVTDMATEDRWPRFSAGAAAIGAASMLSLQLYVHDRNLGALNLISRAPHAFTDESDQIGLLIATHTAIAYANTHKRTQLDAALRGREVIGQAIGILVERHRITTDAAFLLLSRLSQDSNRKLHDIADELVTTGTISGTRTLPPDPAQPLPHASPRPLGRRLDTHERGLGTESDKRETRTGQRRRDLPVEAVREP